MPDMDLRIGIENEMFFNSYRLPQSKDIRKFADDIVGVYNVVRGKMLLQSDFSHKSKAGHYDAHNSTGKWTVTTDDAIGVVSLSSSQETQGRTFSSTLCGDIFTTNLTTMQTPLNLSLRSSTFALTANGGKR